MKLINGLKVGCVSILLFALALTLSAPAHAAITLSPASLPTATVGVAYDQTVVATGGAGGYTYAITAGALPGGLSLNTATGEITGTPPASGVSNFTITATDSGSATGSHAYSISVGTASLTLLPTSLPAGTQNVAYNSQTITAVGGTAPYTFAISSGALPSGMSLDSSGVLSGTPTTNGSFGFIVQATDANGNTGFRTYTLNIGTNTLSIAPASLPNGSQGTPYNQTITASGGTAPYTYTITAGSLPAGLSLNGNTGAITGTPSGNGVSNFTVQANDNVGDTGSKAYSLTVGSNSLVVNPTTLPNGTQGTAYSQTIFATGGTGPYSYAITSGSLPAGLSFNGSTGAITGTPTGTGPSTFTVQATDSISDTGSRTYTVHIGTNSLTVNPASLPNGTQGTPYSQGVNASGGTLPYTFGVTAGSLPTGLALNASTGAITGTPTGSGVSNFTIQAMDANADTGSRAYTVTINLVPLTINPASLPSATLGTAYSQTITATGGTAPYTYAIVSGALPAGLALNGATGAIGGTPTAGGAFNFTVQATDATPNTGTKAYTLNVGTNSLTVNPASLPAGTQGVAYTQTMTASGGTAPYTFTISTGALPAGLALNSTTGAITGTPTTTGTSQFTVSAVDGNGNVGSRALALTIGSNSLTINPSSLPSATLGTAYGQTMTATGGTAPYTYVVLSGALPAGLALNGVTGALSGTPAASGLFNFTIQATDSTSNTGIKAYALNVGTNSLTVNPASLPAGTQGFAYAQAMTATGGTAPYTFTISAGALPAGLALNSATGAITGTPTANGTSTFTVRAADSNGNVGTRALTLTIGSNSLTINPASLTAAVQGTPYSQIVSATGGAAPYTYSIIAGALPPGLSLNSTTGAITGIPTGTGSFSVTIQARDVNGNVGSRVYVAFVVRPNPATDPDVQGLVASQAAAARRFSSTQVTNVTGHLEDLHDAFDPCFVNVGVGVQVYDPATGIVTSNPNGSNPAAPMGSLPGTCAGRTTAQLPLAFWAGGTVQFGSAVLNGASNHFSSGGLTFGADGRISNSLIVGAAFGYGADRTNIGANGTNSNSHTFDAMFYASYQPFDGWFLDAVAGYGTLGFTNQRFDTFDGATVAGNRSGTNWFGSVTLSTDLKSGPLKLSPYIRADLMAASLQGYAEQGMSSLALTYGAVNFNSTSAVVGLRGSYDIPTGWGVVSPTARLEYRRELDGAFNQSMFYSDLGAGQSYMLNQIGTAQNLITGAVGLRVRSGSSLSGELEYGATAGDNATLIQSVRATMRVSF